MRGCLVPVGMLGPHRDARSPGRCPSSPPTPTAHLYSPSSAAAPPATCLPRPAERSTTHPASPWGLQQQKGGQGAERGDTCGRATAAVLPGQAEGTPPSDSAPTFLVGGVVPARAPLAPVAPCRAPPAPHLEAVLRAEEEATVLHVAGLANDASDLVAAEARAVLAPASSRAELGAEGRILAPACSPSPVLLPRQHSPQPRQSPLVPGSAARTAAPCVRCSASPPRPGRCSRSGRGWTGCSAGLGGPAWLEEEQRRELERCCSRQCVGPPPRMRPLLLVLQAAARVLACPRQGMGRNHP